MAILVTGGAGYIGSVTVERLDSLGEKVVVLDNLSRGHRESVDASIPFYHGDAGDAALVERIVREHDVDACMHFAAFAYVGESMKNQPALLREQRDTRIDTLWYSSSRRSAPRDFFFIVRDLR